ncbi:MAG: FIST C-terminal domain-containing protein [Bacteroidetes bacterium]|nr:FIST C-terminal domain-containing protein [Bacteroidota bacterium]MBS1632378.1 FIST C-terminal domain-containing protein [Bacteroidota bacterium]
MQAKSIKGKSPEEIQSALEECIGENFKPTLAIAFISVKQNRKAICKILQNKNIDVFGATSCGEFIDGNQSEGEAGILLLDLSRDYYTILLEETSGSGLENAASQIAREAKRTFKNPTFLLTCTGVNGNAEYFDGVSLVKFLVKELGDESIFFGGMAGDDWTFKGSYIFTNDKESGDGIAALVFDGDKISLNGMAIHGWKPLGLARTFTKSNGTRVYTIDDKPAVEMYLKYLGVSNKTWEEKFDMFKEVSIHYPFIGTREDGESIILSPMSIDADEGALVMDTEVKEGSVFYFTTPPDFEISEEIISEAATLKNEKEMQPDALVIFSCAGRPPVLGPLTTRENDGLAELWQVPMAGFYTYGEFGRTKNGKQHFHSGVCCWVAVKEIDN